MKKYHMANVTLKTSDSQTVPLSKNTASGLIDEFRPFPPRGKGYCSTKN